MFPATFQHGVRDCPFYAPAFGRTSLVEIFRRENCDHDARPVRDCVAEETADMSAWVRKDVQADERDHDCDGSYAQRMLMDEAVFMGVSVFFVDPGLFHYRARLFLNILTLLLLRQLVCGLIWRHFQPPSRGRHGIYLSLQKCGIAWAGCSHSIILLG